MLPFTPEELNTAIAEGRVTERPHPTLPLYIYNYSPEIQYTQQWDNVTRACRGLILDEQGNIVARPWEKFFNLGQVNLPIQFTDPVEVMDKADGSLGILYPTPDGYAIATRGSFTSEQALHATDLWKREYAMYHDYHTETGYIEDYTFLFEIVYSANRIVLDYGDMDDLILLGCVEKDSGYYLGPREAKAILGWLGPVVDVYDFNTITDALANMGRKNKEGYVIRSHNFMVKVKEPDYVDLHRLVTNASPRTVWEQLKAGKSKTEIVSAFPDEFHSYIEGMIDPLMEKFESRVVEILDGYNQASQRVLHSCRAGAERKDYAKEFKKHEDGRYFFALLDNKSIRDSLWAELKPRATEEVPAT